MFFSVVFTIRRVHISICMNPCGRVGGLILGLLTCAPWAGGKPLCSHHIRTEEDLIDVYEMK